MKYVIGNFTVCIILMSASILYGQVYKSKEIQNGYKTGTRDPSGMPGKKYWQNTAEYRIEVEVEPDKKLIRGNESITYFNRSPETLSEIWVHLYADFYKKANARDEVIPEIALTNGVQIEYVLIDHDTLTQDQKRRSGTNLVLELDKPLLSGDSISITIGWTEFIPPVYHNRIGSYDDSTFFIGYWYPRIAVYDDLYGWDQFMYGGIQEFYRDFCNYEVAITVPGIYYVWATGTLQNPSKVYTPSVLQSLSDTSNFNRVVKIIDEPADYPQNKEKRTWEFIANDVGDFAFGISNNFHWQSMPLIINDQKVVINSIFDARDSLRLQTMTAEQAKMMKYFSDELPGWPYPYEHFTTFMGTPIYDGMEFPMMANNGLSESSDLLEVRKHLELTAHEMAHTYFPFLTGINERKYTWMEEGLSVLLSTMCVQEAFPTYFSKYDVASDRYFAEYMNYAGSIYDNPLLVPSILVRDKVAHRHLSYAKSFVAYKVLIDMLGRKLFKKYLIEFINRWSEKHPSPYDFFNTFNHVSGSNLDWFWKAWFQNFGYTDLALKSHGDNSMVIVENTGGLPLPFTIIIHYKDETQQTISKTAEVWREDMEQVLIHIQALDKIKSIRLDNSYWPDLNEENNELIFEDEKI